MISSEEDKIQETSSLSLSSVHISNFMLPPPSRSEVIQKDVSSVEQNLSNTHTTIRASSYENNFDSDENRAMIIDESVLSFSILSLLLHSRLFLIDRTAMMIIQQPY